MLNTAIQSRHRTTWLGNAPRVDDERGCHGSMERIRVLIVDDHPVVRQGLKNFIETRGISTSLAQSAAGQRR